MASWNAICFLRPLVSRYKYFNNIISPGLSTLPDNPEDSRFWTGSPGLQIRVWNLLDNRRSLPFLVESTFWKYNFKYILCCLSYFTVNIERFLTSSRVPLLRNIYEQCYWCKVSQLGKMLQFQQHLFHAFFSQMTSCAVCIIMSFIIPPHQFSIFEDVRG